MCGTTPVSWKQAIVHMLDKTGQLQIVRRAAWRERRLLMRRADGCGVNVGVNNFNHLQRVVESVSQRM